MIWISQSIRYLRLILVSPNANNNLKNPNNQKHFSNSKDQFSAILSRRLAFNVSI